MEKTKHMVALENAGITLFKVRKWVNERVRRGRNKGDLKRIEFAEEVIVNNEAYAWDVYKAMKNSVMHYASYSGYTGKVELIIPHIFENGSLAYWGKKLAEFDIEFNEENITVQPHQVAE